MDIEIVVENLVNEYVISYSSSIVPDKGDKVEDEMGREFIVTGRLFDIACDKAVLYVEEIIN